MTPQLSIAPDGACQIVFDGIIVGRIRTVESGVTLTVGARTDDSEPVLTFVCRGEPFAMTFRLGFGEEEPDD